MELVDVWNGGGAAVNGRGQSVRFGTQPPKKLEQAPESVRKMFEEMKKRG